MPPAFDVSSAPTARSASATRRLCRPRTSRGCSPDCARSSSKSAAIAWPGGRVSRQRCGAIRPAGGRRGPRRRLPREHPRLMGRGPQRPRPHGRSDSHGPYLAQPARRHQSGLRTLARGGPAPGVRAPRFRSPSLLTSACSAHSASIRAEPDAFDDEERALLSGLGRSLAFGLSALRTRRKSSAHATSSCAPRPRWRRSVSWPPAWCTISTTC